MYRAVNANALSNRLLGLMRVRRARKVARQLNKAEQRPAQHRWQEEQQNSRAHCNLSGRGRRSSADASATGSAAAAATHAHQAQFGRFQQALEQAMAAHTDAWSERRDTHRLTAQA